MGVLGERRCEPESLGERGLRELFEAIAGQALKEKVWSVGNRRGEELGEC